MFVAENREGQRFYSLFEDEAILRGISKGAELVCPDCSSLVRFRAGTKTPHFYHQTRCANPNPYSEPESAAHRSGKLALYNWLNVIYPGSRVELEYFISETKQRSDVMLLHPDGQRLAFEFQCSRITGAVWRERHDLYASAGVEDVWILNEDILRYESMECKIISLESEIYKQHKLLSYFNPENETVTFIADGYGGAGRIYDPEQFCDNLKNVRVVNDRIWLLSYENYLIQKEELIRKKALEEEGRRRSLEMQRRRQQEEAEFRKRVREEKESQDSQRFNAHYSDILKNRGSFMQDFTPKELRLFQTLASRYHLTKENFPGMFHLTLEHSDLIVTPPQLWQLWIFDQILNKRQRSVFKKQKDHKIWLDDVKEKFIALRKDGLLRTRHQNDKPINYIFTMYNYISSLNKCGVLENLGSSTTKYQRILVDRIPMFKSHKENAILNMYFEGYIHEKINQLGMEFDEQILQIQVACSKEGIPIDGNVKREDISKSRYKNNYDKGILSLIDEYTDVVMASNGRASRADKDMCGTIIKNFYLNSNMDDQSRDFIRKIIQIHKTGY
ncbi:hypothetical protein GZH47_31445 (plasmid) [Paenibacillus rhizovicinus]|uniref:Competence protein CoiA nuclease-like domain-containing protein n=1 Tax=Paenibacillus rhizovicinus TaxID=2704463 RepID=A0A6C0PA14_9BACL|nr:competence protein CoiA family protein [Paenibacillus rhizovicinus]QHW35417.1 hypothetical protein GZH47_31445 [Paenibacillus rhizovicinus]